MTYHCIFVQCFSIDEKVHVFGYSTCKGKHCQQVFIRVIRLYIRHNLLQHRRREWLYPHLSGVSAIQWFFLVLEYFLHQRVDAATHNQVQVRCFLILVPNVLYFAIHSFVHPEKVLEFIDYQSKTPVYRQLHQVKENVSKITASAQCRNAKFFADFFQKHLA